MKQRFPWMSTVRAAMAAGVATLALHAAQPVAAADQSDPVRLTVANATVSTPPYAAYNTSVPLTLFFKEEGLDVRMVGLGGATVATQALGAGQADIALPASSAPLALVSKMPDVGIVAFYTFINGFQSVPVTREDSPLQTLADLQGKRIGVQTLGNSQVHTTRALVGLAGGNPDSLNFIPVGEGVEAAHALRSGRVDALVLFDGLYGQVRAAGVPLRYLTSEHTGRDKVGFAGVAITRKDFFEKNRDVLVRYGRALAKASVFTKANPEAAVRIHWQVYPETRPRGMSEEEAMALSLASLNARLENIYDVDGQFGASSPEQIEGYIALNQAGGQLAADVSASGLWDPSLLAEINDFDREAVLRLAREWKPE